METAGINELVLTEAEPNGALPRLMAALGAAFRVRPLRELIAIDPALKANAGALILSEEQLVTASEILRAEGRTLRDALVSYRHVMICPFAATPGGLQALGQ